MEAVDATLVDPVVVLEEMATEEEATEIAVAVMEGIGEVVVVAEARASREEERLPLDNVLD